MTPRHFEALRQRFVDAHPGCDKTSELTWEDNRAMVGQSMRIHNARYRANKKREAEREAKRKKVK